MYARRLLSPAIVVGALAVVASAEAGSNASEAAAAKKACIHAAEVAQAQRLEGHLVAAKEALEICAADACPAVVRDDCRTWLADVSASVPTVTFQLDAKASAGRTLELAIDGKPANDALDGREVALDPGEHTVDLTGSDGKSAHQVVKLRVSEKRWLVHLAFEEPKPIVVAAPAPTSTGMRVTPLAWTLFGVGAVSLGTSLFVGLSAQSDAKAMERDCKPACDPSKVADVNTRLVVSDVALGVGIAAVGAATVLVLTSPKAAPPAVTAGPIPGGGVATWAGTF